MTMCAQQHSCFYEIIYRNNLQRWPRCMRFISSVRYSSRERERSTDSTRRMDHSKNVQRCSPETRLKLVMAWQSKCIRNSRVTVDWVSEPRKLRRRSSRISFYMFIRGSQWTALTAKSHIMIIHKLLKYLDFLK